jgi:hypothetical protein
MVESPGTNAGPVGSLRWPLATLILVTAAWLVFLLALGYTGRLQDQWGPAPDVWDALVRDAYVGRRTVPIFTVALLLDLAAAMSLGAGSYRGWPLAVKVLAGALLVPSAALHCLVWCVCVFFAG